MKKLGELRQIIPVFCAFLLICIVISLLSPDFLTVGNLRNVILQASVNAVLAVGLTFVIITAGIDLSVGSVLAFSGMILGFCLHGKFPFPIALCVGLVAGSVFGFINGFLITKGKLPPFIATLGTMSIARGFALVLNNGKPVSGFQSSFRFIASGELIGIPVFILIVAAVYILAYIILNKTPFGRYVYATGGNVEATRLSGVNTNKVLLCVYIISGFLSGLAAIMVTSRINSAQPTAGMMYELDAIAATVIGGTSLMGGYGFICGTLIGALIISVIRNGLNLLDISSFIQQIVVGSVIILAVLIDRLKYGSGFNIKAFLRKYRILLIVIAIAIFGLIFHMGGKSREQAKIPKIGLIVKTLNSPYFISMVNAAKEEMKKYPGYQLVVQAPEREIDVEKQIQYIENMITVKVKVICIAPSGSKEILPGFVKANKAGIPIIVVDTKVDENLAKELGAKYESFIGSDNYDGGRLAARFVVKELGREGKVAVLEGIAGAMTGELRKEGFINTIKSYPGVKVVASQTADFECGRAFDVTQNILQSHPDLQAIFAANDLMALGALGAVEQAGLKGKILIVGFDGTAEGRKAVLAGDLAGDVSQYPDMMGKHAVEYAIKLIRGEEIPRKLSTKLEIITRELLEKEEKCHPL